MGELGVDLRAVRKGGLCCSCPSGLFRLGVLLFGRCHSANADGQKTCLKVWKDPIESC